jgi:V/A-type H+/Na+-transporting ATPase subunit F
MTHTVRILCRPATATGFTLAGLVADTVGEGEDALSALQQLTARPEVGVVLVEESLRERLPPEVQARLDRVARPVVVPFPGPTWRAVRPAEEWVVELLRRAIGYRVRLR